MANDATVFDSRSRCRCPECGSDYGVRPSSVARSYRCRSCRCLGVDCFALRCSRRRRYSPTDSRRRVAASPDREDTRSAAGSCATMCFHRPPCCRVRVVVGGARGGVGDVGGAVRHLRRRRGFRRATRGPTIRTSPWSRRRDGCDRATRSSPSRGSGRCRCPDRREGVEGCRTRRPPVCRRYSGASRRVAACRPTCPPSGGCWCGQ